MINMEVEIKKLDDFGRGIGFINDKIVFVPKTIIGDIANINIVVEKKNYCIGELINIVKPSKLRTDAKCPFFNVCGGCSLQNIEYRIELVYKLDKVNNLLKKNKIDYEIKEIIKSDKQFNYRNKVSLKIENGKLGYYESETHNIVEIGYCLLLANPINEVLKDISSLNIINGELTIRSNYKGELLIIIYSKDILSSYESIINNHKVAGIILNNEVIYGSDFFVDKIEDYIFKVSYDSFFQINPYICSKIFQYINIFTLDAKNLIDLYSGVGTLSIVSAHHVKSVLGVEIVKNAVSNAQTNALMNNLENVSFIESDTDKITENIKGKDFVIVDPPRSGLTKNIIDSVIDYKVENMIYISCDPLTLIRDLKLLLNDYEIKDMKLLDMFPNTYHVESIVVLNKK